MLFSNNTLKLKQKSEPSDTSVDVLKVILNIYKILKEIACYEVSQKKKNKYSVLNDLKLEKIKNLESSIDCCLVAYEFDGSLQKKQDLLGKVQQLLCEYKNTCAKENSKSKTNNDDFNKLFQE